ncbi:MAG: type II toxin-antitoxin system HicA family toxin [Nitrospinota bacterium]
MAEQKITPTHYEILIKIFELDGFVVKRKKGDHIIMTQPGIKRPRTCLSS